MMIILQCPALNENFSGSFTVIAPQSFKIPYKTKEMWKY
jgi:hypothetical protein